MEAARVGPAEASSTRAWACAAAAAEAAVVDCRPRTGYPARARVSGACFRQRAKTVAPLLLFVLMIWMLLDVARVRGPGATRRSASPSVSQGGTLSQASARFDLVGYTVSKG